jgi:hypothetical protein
LEIKIQSLQMNTEMRIGNIVRKTILIPTATAIVQKTIQILIVMIIAKKMTQTQNVGKMKKLTNKRFP